MPRRRPTPEFTTYRGFGQIPTELIPQPKKTSTNSTDSKESYLKKRQEKTQEKAKDKRKKKSLEQQIDEIIGIFGIKEINTFFEDCYELLKLFDVEPGNDWVEIEVGKEDRDNVRLIRTAYILSRMAERHTGRLLLVKTACPLLYLKLNEFSEELGKE